MCVCVVGVCARVHACSSDPVSTMAADLVQGFPISKQVQSDCSSARSVPQVGVQVPTQSFSNLW